MSIGRRMDKEVVVHIHSGILLIYEKNTFESVLIKWTKLEPIIQSEVSQKNTDILRHIYIYIYIYIYMKFREMVTTLYARQQKRHRYKEQTFGLCGIR